MCTHIPRKKYYAVVKKNELTVHSIYWHRESLGDWPSEEYEWHQWDKLLNLPMP